MKQSYIRRTAIREKQAKEREYLSHQHLIKTATELKEILNEIDDKCTNTTVSKKMKEKYALLRMQINIRKKVLKQNIQITLSHKGKLRPLEDIIQNLIDFLKKHPPALEDSNEPVLDINDPFTLIGKEILHKFILDSGEDQWFRGMVLSYNSNAKHMNLFMKVKQNIVTLICLRI